MEPKYFKFKKSKFESNTFQRQCQIVKDRFFNDYAVLLIILTNVNESEKDFLTLKVKPIRLIGVNPWQEINEEFKKH